METVSTFALSALALLYFVALCLSMPYKDRS
jgi:hypothetical protein